MITYEKVFNTKDLYQACALRAVGFKLLTIDFNSQGIATFVFSDPENKAIKIVSQFWDRELKADIRTFIEAINELKSRIANRH